LYSQCAADPEEYLLDYGTPETRIIGEKLIGEELAKMDDGDMKDNVIKRLQEIRGDKNRDLYF
jgi:2-iminoacetate synthase